MAVGGGGGGSGDGDGGGGDDGDGARGGGGAAAAAPYGDAPTTAFASPGVSFLRSHILTYILEGVIRVPTKQIPSIWKAHGNLGWGGAPRANLRSVPYGRVRVTPN